MLRARYIAIFIALAGSSWVKAQTPEALYTWNDATIQDWEVWGAGTAPPEYTGYRFVPGTGTGRATVSAATGDLVVAENGTGLPNQGAVGGTLWILDSFDRSRENWSAVKGNLDVTGLQYIEMDVKHNSLSATVNVSFNLTAYEGASLADATTVANFWPIGPGAAQTIRIPLNLLTTRQQGNIKNVWIIPQDHLAVGNLTWTISAVRSVGTPLAYRDIVTSNADTNDEGVDGAFPLNPNDMLAIVGNEGAVNQLGLSRNPAGSGSLQWTDKGGTGASGSESGATIGWGNGAGWRNIKNGDPSSGNSYNERMCDFSNYDRMTVRISAQDNVNPTGTVGIEAPFLPSEFGTPVVLPAQNLTTDGQYHELVYDLSSVPFLRILQHWGLDVAPHPNNIVFNIDNIRLWNSTTPQGVAGDYNGNGVVDAADYVLWRNGGTLQNEGVTPGSNTPEDYTFWRAHFGATSGSGAVAAAAVPEPASGLLMLVASLLFVLARRER